MDSCVSLVFNSSSSGPFERGEGLAPFLRSRTLGRHFRPTRWPRSLVARKGIRRPQAKGPDPRIKDRPIDPMSGKNSSAKEPEPVSSLGKRTGASPSCRECLTNPCLLMLPFRFADAMRMRPLLSGALRAPFIQRSGHHRAILILCKAIAAIAAIMVNRQSRRRRSWRRRSGSPLESYAWRPPIGWLDSRNQPEAEVARCKNQADRAKTRCEAPYGCAENQFSRFFPLCATIARNSGRA